MANVVNTVPAIASAVMDVMILVCFIFLIYWCVLIGGIREKGVIRRMGEARQIGRTGDLGCVILLEFKELRQLCVRGNNVKTNEPQCLNSFL